MQRYKALFGITTLLGVAFMVLQFWGFYEMHFIEFDIESKTRLSSLDFWDKLKYIYEIVFNTPHEISKSYIYVITAAHLLHMLGGVISMVVFYLKMRFRRTKKVYSATGLEILGTYWHFVDILWLYLFIFFYINQK